MMTSLVCSKRAAVERSQTPGIFRRVLTSFELLEDGRLLLQPRLDSACFWVHTGEVSGRMGLEEVVPVYSGARFVLRVLVWTAT